MVPFPDEHGATTNRWSSWSGPERMEDIKRNWLEGQKKLKRNARKRKLIIILGDGDEDCIASISFPL
jgi:hypothetical protein